jgi:uncharacterized protein DUF955
MRGGRKALKRKGGEMQRLTIPKRVQLPFGYVVTIKQVTDSEMEEIVEDGTGESVDGYWDPDERVLYIRKSLPIRRRRYILAHELGHAWNDWQHHAMDNGIASSY